MTAIPPAKAGKDVCRKVYLTLLLVKFLKKDREEAGLNYHVVGIKTSSNVRKAISIDAVVFDVHFKEVHALLRQKACYIFVDVDG